MRVSAARALGELRADPNTVIPQLEPLLQDGNTKVAVEAALALRRFGGLAASSVPRVLAALRGALTRCNHALIEALAKTVAAIAADPMLEVRDYFSEADPEMCRLALSAVEGPAQPAHKGTPAEESTGGGPVA